MKYMIVMREIEHRLKEIVQFCVLLSIEIWTDWKRCVKSNEIIQFDVSLLVTTRADWKWCIKLNIVRMRYFRSQFELVESDAWNWTSLKGNYSGWCITLGCNLNCLRAMRKIEDRSKEFFSLVHRSRLQFKLYEIDAWNWISLDIVQFSASLLTAIWTGWERCVKLDIARRILFSLAHRSRPQPDRNPSHNSLKCTWIRNDIYIIQCMEFWNYYAEGQLWHK